MSFTPFESTFRRHAGDLPPNNSPFEPGGRIRFRNAKKGGWTKKPTEGVIVDAQWERNGEFGQWVVDEVHVTRRGNAVERRIQTGFAQVEIETDEPAAGALDMQGPERPPFLKGRGIRYSDKGMSRTNMQNWNFATVLEVYMEQTLREPRWTFLVQPNSLGGVTQKPEVIGFTKFDIVDAASKKHFA